MVLLVGLVMLLLMTVVGLAAIRGSGMQEAMAGNMRDLNVAFQAAEAGLRAGEEVFEASGSFPVFDGSDPGYEPDLNIPAFGRTPPISWDSTTWQSNNAKTTNMNLDFVREQPRYVIEKLIVPVASAAAAEGSGIGAGSLETVQEMDFYRITSRGVGGMEGTEVLLQAIYKTPDNF